MDQKPPGESVASDLLSLVLSLKPLEIKKKGEELPSWWGRAAHALLLNTIREYDPQFAEQLHANNHQPEFKTADPPLNTNVRPFTVSSLLGRYPHGALDIEDTYILRLTSFQPQLTALLHQAVLAGPLAQGRQIELDFLPFQIEKACWLVGDHPWAGKHSYQDLGASLLLAKQAAPR